MRRAAVVALRLARRSAFRKLINKAPLSSSSIHHAVNTPFAVAARRYSTHRQALQSSMRIPKTPLALAASVGALGAWYAYGTEKPGQINVQQPISSPQTRSLTTAADVAERTELPKAPAPVAAGQEAHRKALVVDNDQFFTGAIVGEGPLEKDTDDYGRKVLEMMTPEQATERLRKNEASYLVGRGRGVVRYDVVQLPSNDPIEDDHAEKIVEVSQTVAHAGDAPSSDWMFWGVFDGHSGWTTSAKLRQVLIQYAARELNATYTAALKNATAPRPSPEAIDMALKLAFTKLDNEICLESVKKVANTPSRSFAAEMLAPALSGSCALLSFYDSHSKTLRVACTGDSRAVLGRRNIQTGKWYATPLSEDQTGSNPNEEARMRAEHPGEDNVIRAGRVLGNLEPTRAFGDAFYKWSRETQDKIKQHFFGRTPHPLLKTPPYVTAEPVVSTTTIEPSKGDFDVLATDGLWEMLTNEEVIGLVGQWVEKQNKKSSKSSNTAWLTSWFKGAPSAALPVEKGGNMDKTGRINKANDPKGSEKPIRQQQWAVSAENNGRFVVEDENAATHLVRNALGGKDRDMVSALLTLPSPYSRRYRDDLTVEVIFFGEGEQTGSVQVNPAATNNGAAGGDLKAKL
jgi:pyruvate dehydrogenase phosphatase